MVQIGAYDIEDKYVAAGAGVLVLGGILLTRRKPQDTVQTAEIRPAEGLSWSDVFPTDKGGSLIGPGGDIGEPGPPGIPGTTPPTTISDPPDAFGCTADSDCICAANRTNCRCVAGACQSDPISEPDPINPNPRDPKNPNKGKDECRNDNQCRNNEKCRHGKCVAERNNGGRNDNQGSFTPTPNMPDRNNDPKNRNRTDPNLDRPKDRKRRDNARSIFDTRPNQDERHEDREDRSRNNRTVEIDPINGGIKIDRRGGRERERGKNANSDASGGNVRLGDIDKGTHGDIDVGGGRAISISDDGRRKQQEDKDRKDREDRARQQNNNNRPNNNNKKGKGGYGLAENGFGRADGIDNADTGWTRTNISPGSITGGFMPVPAALTGGKKSATIQSGETLKGLARRQTGIMGFWPRIAALNQDIETPNGHIPAGTKLRY